MKETTEVLATIRNTLAILASLAERTDRPGLAFLIGMAELEAAQAEASASVEADTRR